MSIEKYYTSKGKRRFLVNHYAGIDYYTGKRIRIRKAGFLAFKDAQNFLNKELLKLSAKKELEKNQHLMTFQEVSEQWLIYHETQVKESTYNTDVRNIKNKILPWFGEIIINRIDVRICQKAVNKWYSTMVKAANMISLTNRIFKFAINQGYCSDNPMSKVIRPKNTYKEDYDAPFYDKETLSKFLSHVKSDEPFKGYVMLHTLAYTGLRRGELFALQWMDINFKVGTITVNHNLSYNSKTKEHRLVSPKTKSSKRTISLDKKTLSILNEWRKYQLQELFTFGIHANRPEQIVFTLHDNQYMRPHYLRGIMERTIKKYELPHMTIHGLRHTHCSLLFSAKVPMDQVKERLGHSDITTTLNIYNHITNNEIEETADLFSAFKE